MLMRSLEKFVGGRPSAAGKDHMIYHMIYKAVKHRYSSPIIQPEPEGSTKGYPLDSVEVLRYLKNGVRIQRSFRHSDTERLSRSDEALKLKNFKKDVTLNLSKSINQEWYEHVSPEVTRSQDDKVTRRRNKIMLG
ncbi:hypothetical protein Tco_0436510 [Tanacetum coccineum]